MKLFEEAGILTKHDFKGGKARYETIVESHHDHLIDIKSGEIIEFVDDEIEKLLTRGCFENYEDALAFALKNQKHKFENIEQDNIIKLKFVFPEKP